MVQRVLVTGASGFIGSHLVERLLEGGAKVRALVRYNSRREIGHLKGLDSPNLEIMLGDVRDPGSADRAAQGCSAVYHLAALIAIPYSYHAPHSFIDTNVKGTLHLLEAARRHKVGRFVHTSTSEVYGTAQYAPMDEAHPLQPQSPYAASKVGADMLALSFHRSFGLPVVVLRPFNTFGPRQSLRAVIPTVLAQAAFGSGRPALGRLDPVRDFNYVADTVEAFILAGRRREAVGQVINVGTGKGRSVAEVVRLGYALAGRPAPRPALERARLRPASSEVFKLVCGAGKARKLLGWKPRTDFEEGLRRTLDYVRLNVEPREARDYVL